MADSVFPAMLWLILLRGDFNMFQVNLTGNTLEILCGRFDDLGARQLVDEVKGCHDAKR